MAILSEPDESTHDNLTQGTTAVFVTPPSYFAEALEDAERLLKYTAESGIEIDQDTRHHILHARSAISIGWEENTAADLLAALAKLAEQLKPISAESLKSSRKDARDVVRHYWLLAVCLASVIFPISLATFVSTANSKIIQADIAVANDLADRLRAQVGPRTLSDNSAQSRTLLTDNATVTAELETFYANIREIDTRALQLNFLVFYAERDPLARFRLDPAEKRVIFQLPSGVPDFVKTIDHAIDTYENTRYFAQTLLSDVSYFYDPITACLLPPLYALLGTCAYFLRIFERQIATRTFTPSAVTSARFLTAAIGGAVLGLFNTFTIGHGASVSPLAIAFLVGYSIDVFFEFLEGIFRGIVKT